MIENILLPIVNVLIQTAVFSYVLLVIAETLEDKKYTKKQILMHIGVVFISAVIGSLLLKVVPMVNMLVTPAINLVSLIYILRLKPLKSLGILAINFVTSVLTEFLVVFIAMTILRISFEGLLEYKYSTSLCLMLQAALLVLLIKFVLYIIDNHADIKESIKNISIKQIKFFFVIVSLYILPQVIVYSFTMYSSSSLFLAINIVQSVLITFFLLVYLKKDALHDKTQAELTLTSLHNQTMVGMVDGVRTLKHDYNNIIQALNGYVSTKQYDRLEEHINGVLRECNVVNNLSVIDPKIFNCPAMYGIVGAKYFIALEADIVMDLDIVADIPAICFPKPHLSRMLGILLDNAIEATNKVKEKYIRLEIKYDSRKCADTIKVINTYDTNIEIDMNRLFSKGYSSKEVKSGIGLWEVKKLTTKHKNSQAFATIERGKFVQHIVVERIEGYEE